MITIQGTHNTALCYTSQLEETAAAQIKVVCDQEAFSDCKIRIMPDVHAGKGCTIGTTMTITDKIVPGMVGVDIGCGMETVRLGASELDFDRLDKSIRKNIPSGFEVRNRPHKLADEIDLNELRCIRHVNLHRAVHSIGTLGGGNHFIEVAKGNDGALYFVVHSGSRHLGCEVAEYYQTEGYNALCGNAQFQLEEVISELKSQSRNKEIQSAIKSLKEQTAIPVPKDLAYVDESPMAYKSMDEIINQIEPTAEIVDRIKPVYNFKAAEKNCYQF